MMKLKLKKLIFATLIIFFSFSALNAQDAANVLPLHTGKSYILDFPVKVTRVVGGDPTAMELNLFKKDGENETTGYQLLIAPIAERNTNIIIWTDMGMYVFDVIIDNASPYTAETIVHVPDNKKFTIPLVQTAQANMPEVYSSAAPVNELTPSQEQAPALDNNEPDESEISKESNSGDGEVSFLDSDFELDKPPGPDENQPEPDKKEQKHKNKLASANPLKAAPVKLKPQVKIEHKKPEKVEKEEPKAEVIEIDLKPQTVTDYGVHSSLDSEAHNLYSGNLEVKNDGLRLEINSVNLVEDSLVIHLSLENITENCKYLLWDLTKVTDAKGQRLHVRNQNLPPGIISPGRKIKGDIVAYTKNNSQILPKDGSLHFALLGLQGETLFKTEIPLKNTN